MWAPGLFIDLCFGVWKRGDEISEKTNIRTYCVPAWHSIINNEPELMVVELHIKITKLEHLLHKRQQSFKESESFSSTNRKWIHTVYSESERGSFKRLNMQTPALANIIDVNKDGRCESWKLRHVHHIEERGTATPVGQTAVERQWNPSYLTQQGVVACRSIACLMLKSLFLCSVQICGQIVLWLFGNTSLRNNKGPLSWTEK